MDREQALKDTKRSSRDFRISDLSDEEWKTFPSGAFASFMPFLLFEHGLVKITRDSFGDCFVGDCGCVFVFASIHQ